MHPFTHILYIWLVVLTILKILVNGKDYPIYEMENNPAMFETTNQWEYVAYFPVRTPFRNPLKKNFFPPRILGNNGVSVNLWLFVSQN